MTYLGSFVIVTSFNGATFNFGSWGLKPYHKHEIIETMTLEPYYYMLPVLFHSIIMSEAQVSCYIKYHSVNGHSAGFSAPISQRN